MAARASRSGQHDGRRQAGGAWPELSNACPRGKDDWGIPWWDLQGLIRALSRARLEGEGPDKDGPYHMGANTGARRKGNGISPALAPAGEDVYTSGPTNHESKLASVTEDGCNGIPKILAMCIKRSEPSRGSWRSVAPVIQRGTLPGDEGQTKAKSD